MALLALHAKKICVTLACLLKNMYLCSDFAESGQNDVSKQKHIVVVKPFINGYA